MDARRWFIIVIGAFFLVLLAGFLSHGEEAQNAYADNDTTPPRAGVKPADIVPISPMAVASRLPQPIRARRENQFLAFATDVVPGATDPNGNAHPFYSAGLMTAEAMSVADCVTTEMIHARGGSEEDPLTKPLFRNNLECPAGIVFSNAANHTFKLLFRHADTRPKKIAAYVALGLYDAGYSVVIAHNIQQLEKPKYQQRK